MHRRSMFEQKLVSTKIIPFGHSLDSLFPPSSEAPPSAEGALGSRDAASGDAASFPALGAPGDVGDPVGTGASGSGLASPQAASPTSATNKTGWLLLRLRSITLPRIIGRGSCPRASARSSP